MSAQPKPAESARIRFSTPNPWDDPLFRSAIRGPEREQRRADMQATIDRADAQRAGKIYERNADPIGEAPPPPKKTPELARDPAHPQRPAEPWVCPGCRAPFETANGVRAHKANCVGLYERRKNGVGPCDPSTGTSTRPAAAAPGALFATAGASSGSASVSTASSSSARPDSSTTHPAPQGPRAAKSAKASSPSIEATPPKPGPAYTCAKCDAGFASMAAVIRHRDEAHQDFEPAPVAREPIQADTPASAPACPIGQVQEGEMSKVEEKKGARPCGCGGTGRHRKTCALSSEGDSVRCSCGRSFVSESALGGHLRWAPSCRGPNDRAGDAPSKAPATPAPEPPSLRCLVVRVRGAVPLEVECATPEDAAAFVRLVAASA